MTKHMKGHLLFYYVYLCSWYTLQIKIEWFDYWENEVYCYHFYYYFIVLCLIIPKNI